MRAYWKYYPGALDLTFIWVIYITLPPPAIPRRSYVT